MTGAAIEELGKRFNLRPDSVSIDHSGYCVRLDVRQ